MTMRDEVMREARRRVASSVRGFLAPDGVRRLVSLDRTDASEALSKALDARGASQVLLTGQAGLGKTLAASWLAFEPYLRAAAAPRAWPEYEEPVFLAAQLARVRGLYGQIIRGADLAAALRPFRDEEQVRLDVRRPGWVVVDDIGTCLQPARESDALLEVLNERNSRARRLVVTTNLRPEALAERFDDRVLDRLMQGAIIEVEGVSYRRQA